MKTNIFRVCLALTLLAVTAVSANKDRNRARQASQRAAKDGQIKKERQRLKQYSPHQGANSPEKKGKRDKKEE